MCRVFVKWKMKLKWNKIIWNKMKLNKFKSWNEMKLVKWNEMDLNNIKNKLGLYI